MTDVVPLGDRGFLARFADEESAANWVARLLAQRVRGVIDIVPAYSTVGVHADPELIDLDELAELLSTLEPQGSAQADGRVIEIPVLYDGEDLDHVATRLELAPAEVIDAHCSQNYRVFALGFQPGFPYAGYLPTSLTGLPRRGEPRTQVPAGSVAIVGKQTAIYPNPSPGGWHLIGRTPLVIADLPRGHFPIRAGDWLRFVKIDHREYQARLGEHL